MDRPDNSDGNDHILLIFNHDLTQMSDFRMKKLPINKTNNNNNNDDDDDNINKTKNHVSEKRAIIIQHGV